MMNGYTNGSSEERPVVVRVCNSITPHKNDVLSVAWTGSLLASGSADKKICVWKVSKKHEGHVELEEAAFSPLTDHIYHVQCVHFSSFGVFLTECATDGVIAVWDTATGKKVGTANLPAQTLSAARCCRISPNTHLVAAGGDSDCVALWTFDRNHGMNLIKVFSGHEATVKCVCFTHDSRLLLSGSTAGDIRIWDCLDLKDQAIAVQRDAHDLGCTCMDIAPYKVSMPNGETAFHIATGGYDNAIKLWHLIDRSTLPTTKLLPAGAPLSGHSADICSVRFANQAKMLISCSSDRTMLIWDPVNSVPLKRIGPLTKYVRSCCFSSDDGFIMAGFSGGIIGFWRVAATGTECEEQSITIAKGIVDRKVQLDFLEETAPDEFLCPITQEIMNDPVVALDGFSYERSAIDSWFRSHETSPKTNLILSSRITVANFNLKLLINKWLQSNSKTSFA